MTDVSGTMETMDHMDESLRIVYILSVSYVVIVPIICLLGIIGNGLVIWFVVFKMKKMVNSVWFLSLAIADFMFSLYLSFVLISSLLGFHQNFGNAMCRLNAFAVRLNLSASIFQLTIISIDRYICTVFPVWCLNYRTMRLAVKVVLVMWMASFLFGLYHLLKVRSSHSDDYMECLMEQSMDISETILGFIILFALPFTIIIYCNIVVLLRIRRNIRTTPTKPFKVIASVIISFFICWFPMQICSFIVLILGSNVNAGLVIFFMVSTLLVYSNSCVNPLLYVLIGQEFKGKCCSAIKTAFERAFAEDTNLRDSETHTTIE